MHVLTVKERTHAKPYYKVTGAQREDGSLLSGFQSNERKYEDAGAKCHDLKGHLDIIDIGEIVNLAKVGCSLGAYLGTLSRRSD
jgi:hypothetical protein